MRFAVVGAGVVGCLVAALAARLPGTRVELIKRLSNAGLGYLLAPRVLEEARAKRAG